MRPSEKAARATLRARALIPLSLLVLAAAGIRAERPRNVVFILSDDHRHDFLGHHPDAPEFLETPSLDRLAAEGVRFTHAFVSTSLCSPSRASILTGQYMHHHRVVDNQRPVPEGAVFFPELLQDAGWDTAFVGKWHMGHDDDSPRPGFDHWASFRGQGTYFDPLINIDGERRRFEGYTADVLADLAIEWLRGRGASGGDDAKGADPFFLYLSFKAVHYPFTPPPRHERRYAGVERLPRPQTMSNTEENYATQPQWVRERRYSIHGIDHMETGNYDEDPVPSFDEFYRDYTETVHALDESIGRVVRFLDDSGLGASTLVVYTSDNGFALGEHGFYDKRDAFEESIRVPLIARAPGWIEPGSEVERMIQNIDFAPTILDLAGVDVPEGVRFDGRSFVPLVEGDESGWREHILYEYHWEWNFPATPTTFALRTERYKYIYYHGVWDVDGFYDLETDPHERHNLVRVPAYAEDVATYRARLFAELGASGGLDVPVRVPAGERLDARKLRR